MCAYARAPPPERTIPSERPVSLRASRLAASVRAASGGSRSGHEAGRARTSGDVTLGVEERDGRNRGAWASLGPEARRRSPRHDPPGGGRTPTSRCRRAGLGGRTSSRSLELAEYSSPLVRIDPLAWRCLGPRVAELRTRAQLPPERSASVPRLEVTVTTAVGTSPDVAGSPRWMRSASARASPTASPGSLSSRSLELHAVDLEQLGVSQRLHRRRALRGQDGELPEHGARPSVSRTSCWSSRSATTRMRPDTTT